MTELTPEIINSWADDPKGPVALHLKQKLLPVEGEDAVIFPPTYAGIGYNIDTLSDGTKVATIDSVGSQANRMEPIFKAAKPGEPENPLAALVPQIDIAYGNRRTLSIFEAGHRLGDAIVRSSKTDSFDLPKAAKEAFEDFQERGDATKIAKLAPTSLVFGVWDSRDTQAKLPRIVQSVIRAWHVDVLTRSAVYTAPLDYSKLGAFDASAKEKAEKDEKRPESKRGFVNALATGTHGGVVARDRIEREVTVNLLALRRLKGENAKELRRYILGLSLVAAIEPIDGFLRAGCLLTLDPQASGLWAIVNRDGSRESITMGEELVGAFARSSAKSFGKGRDQPVVFNTALAKEDISRGR